MSEEALQEVISRALNDDDFFKQLVYQPNQALRDYDLTGIEKQTLGQLDVNHLAQLNWSLDERQSKSVLTLNDLKTLLGL